MRNLLSFLLKYNNIIIFLILQGIAFYWLTNGNNYHNSIMVKAIHSITRGMEERINNTRTYLRLREINSDLASENSVLRNTLQQLQGKPDLEFITVSDTLSGQEFSYTSARVINNSVNRQKNYFTLDKGTRHGLNINMAVTSNNNVAGMIVGCSGNFSVAISLLNLDFRLSARIRSNGYFGSLTWDGRNYRHALLNEIPQHVAVSIGDTVETTSYSAIFPEGVPIGTVSNLKKSGSDFYVITVELFTDFKKLSYVDVTGNLKRTERVELENQFQ